ncbi:non-ribosomal peptide synthetase [Photobacterium sp. CAU 1568]|uniref:Non-ribosomal peptide synthetase n=1 Tax=Photobacterium arenosum TaxID=2774143 RepID=A0ABR9BRK2_9GAMM|nr:non-ribosomal peptide synthetase [Photobacterium arenosum]MBD8515207.1 non-ribosomal peptide synthetase [Photobacterium arenosum]
MILNELLTRMNCYENKLAVIDEQGHYTYKSLNDRINNIASSIHVLEHKPKYIAVFLPGSFQFLAGALATVFSGISYIPVDPNIGASRLKQIHEQTNCLVLTSSKFRHVVPEGIECIDIEKTETPQEWPVSSRQGQECLYTIFTSGTTGKPKGAQVHVSGVDNLLDWYTKELNITQDDVVLIPSSIGFDLTQKNMFSALSTGALLVFPELSPFDPVYIRNLIAEHRVTKFNCTPSTLSLISDTNVKEYFSSLDTVVLGGEQIAVTVIEHLHELNPNIRFMNSYGPTECSDVVCFHWITAESIRSQQDIPIGKNIPNTRLELENVFEDDTGRELGEIVIKGEPVGLGYLDQSRNSNFDLASSERSYRTGDLGYFEHGQLIYKGRMDRQVKFNGCLVNLAEIEYCLLSHEAIINAFVSLDESGKTLVAWYQLKEDMIVPQHQVTEYLEKELPTYMQPNKLLCKDSFPLNQNNKVDATKLLGELHSGLPAKPLETTSATEQFIFSTINELTKEQVTSKTQSLFDLGMSSLQMVQLLNRINRKYDLALTPRDLFGLQNVGDAISFIDSKKVEDLDLNTLII